MTEAFDPTRDLRITRTIAAPLKLVWTAWTTPAHLKEWWAPKPWETPHVEMDVRPGGKFATLMRGPNGTEHASEGCFLDVIENERIVFTDALRGGCRPNGTGFMTAVITMAPAGEETEYAAHVLHASEAERIRHEEMGFQDGWGAAVGQLEEVAKSLK